MHYIIDGYNLLFRNLQNRKTIRESREQFIAELDEIAQTLKLDITIIFDGKFRKGGGRRTHFQSLEIIYTSHGETADEYIVSELKSCENARFETVITSDRDLAWQCKRQKAKVEKVSTFLTWLKERYKKRKKSPRPINKIKQTTKTKAKPTPKTITDNLLEEYQEIFEKRLKESKPQEKKKKPLSEFDRWLQIFEKREKEQCNEEEG